jgi:hypothetical protein
MKQMFAVILMILISSAGQAKDMITCESSQTGYSYLFNIGNGTLTVSDEGEVFASASVVYTPGEGEDVIYTIESDGVPYGYINGEEGLRGTLSHELFAGDLQDNGLQCEYAAAPEIVSASCSANDDYRVDIFMGSIGGKGTGSVTNPLYTVFKGDTVVTAMNPIEMQFSGYEDTLMMSHIWTFEGGNNLIGLAVPGSAILPAGTYEAKGTIAIELAGGESVIGEALDCTVTVR